MTLFKTAKPPFYDSWETASEEMRQSFQHKQLNEMISYAKEFSPFYKTRLDGFDKNASNPLKEVPILESHDLRGILPPVSSNLLAINDQNYTVFQSGGTTGNPKTTLFSHEELELLNLGNARGFFALGLTESDRVANLFAVGGLYMTFIHINRMLQQYGCMNFPFSNQTNPEFIIGMTKHFDINVFTGISSVVLTNLRQLYDSGEHNRHIQKVFYGGETMYESDKEEIRKKFGTEVIAAPGYGTVDTWYLGYQCLKCSSSVFHAHDDQCYIEIINEETGLPCAVGEKGMIYATPYVRKLTPIIRYRVGDLAYWCKGKCECGRTTPTFKLLGRGDDVLRIGYDSIDYNFVQELVLKFPQLSGTVQMEKKRHDGKDELIIRIESLISNETLDAVKKMHQELLLSRPGIGEFIKKGTVHPVRIELVAPLSIARNTRTGKLIRVIDVET